ncbi:MAG TPA: DinB family protein [Candidatus Eisenbacteria bacterium]
MSTLAAPGAGEFAPFYAGYIATAGGDPLGLMERQVARFRRLGETLTEAQAAHRYAPGKWSVKEVLGHLIDGERVFCYRALRIARGDATPLAGFDENVYVAAAGSDRRTAADLAGELVALRMANLAFFHSLDDVAFGRIGVANDVPVSVRALAFIMAGHTEHHLGVIGERYGIATAG